MSHDGPREGSDHPRPPEPGTGQPPPTYGSQPPPPGGYQSPGEGGYPPGGGSSYPTQQPGGGYPPGPSGGGYGGPSTATGFSVGAAFGFGWRMFWANAGTIVVVALAYLAVLIGLQVVFTMAVPGQGDNEAGTVATFVGSLFVTVVSVVVSAVMQAGIARGALDITRGRRLEVGTMFRLDNIGTVVLASILVGIATGIGFALLIVPGLLVVFFTQFTVWFIVDRQLGVIDAIKASCRLVGQNFGPMVVFFLASLLAFVLGALALVVGLLVAVPVVYIAQGYAYRTMRGEAVAV